MINIHLEGKLREGEGGPPKESCFSLEPVTVLIGPCLPLSLPKLCTDTYHIVGKLGEVLIWQVGSLEENRQI